MKTALVRSKYAGWCGGTAARAASCPIRNTKQEETPGAAHRNIKPGNEYSGALHHA